MPRGMSGKKHSKETKEKIKAKLKGRKLPAEQVKKMIGRKRKPFSEETKRKMSEAQRGSKNYRWKGGTNPLDHIIRKSFRYRLWRSDIFLRDNFTCVWCEKKGVKLNADHIKPFSIILKENDIKNLTDALNCEELWNIDNGRTLCIDCHKKTDTYGGNKKNYNSYSL